MNNINDEKKENPSNDCGCDHEEGENKMYLQLDDDTDLECDVLAIFDVDDKEYIVLLPIEEEEALIYQYISLEDDQVDLISIENEEEFEKVAELFYDMYLDEEESEDNK